MRYIPIILLALFLTGCAGTAIETTCPPPVYPTAAVGEELNTIPMEGYDALWSWIGDVYVLNKQLALCS